MDQSIAENINENTNENVERQIMDQLAPDSTVAESSATSVGQLGEIGQTGLNRWGQSVYEEFLPILLWPRAARIYKEMANNDPVIGAVLLCVRELIAGVSWKVVAASPARGDQQAAQFLTECMTDMMDPWSQLITEAISCYEYGFSFHEIVYKKRSGPNRNKQTTSKFSDGKIGWSKIVGRSQDSWAGWCYDAPMGDQLVGMWQQTHTTKVMIPLDKAVLFRTTAVRSNPEGRSALRNAYRPWYFKKHIEEIEGIGIERDLAGLPTITPPEGVNIWDEKNENAMVQRRNAETLVRNIRRDKSEGVVLPYGWELKLLSSSGNRQFDTNAIINRYDQRIAITLLADIIMLGADKVGSFALASVKKSLLAASLDGQVASMCDEINRHVIPNLFALNVFPGMTQPPHIEVSSVEAPDLTTMGNYISQIAKAGMPLFPDIDLENGLRSAANLPLTTEAKTAKIIKAKNTAAQAAAKSKDDTKGDNGDNSDDTDEEDDSTSDNKKNKPVKGGE
jgi:hypothetical protein